MIQTNYDAKADVMHITFGSEDVQSYMSEEIAPGLYVEFDRAGNAVGIEITSASQDRRLVDRRSRLAPRGSER